MATLHLERKLTKSLIEFSQREGATLFLPLLRLQQQIDQWIVAHHGSPLWYDSGISQSVSTRNRGGQEKSEAVFVIRLMMLGKIPDFNRGCNCEQMGCREKAQKG